MICDHDMAVDELQIIRAKLYDAERSDFDAAYIYELKAEILALEKYIIMSAP